MKKHHAIRSMRSYVGFLDDRPHVQLAAARGGPRTVTVYLSKAAAHCAYADVRTTRLVFDAEWPASRKE